MFKQTPKLDPKIRFQQSSFRRALQSARAYKRGSRPISSSAGFRNFLRKLGLSNIWAQIAVPVVFFGIIYLIYVPNFLYIKTIQVTGLSADETSQISYLAEAYLKEQPLKARQNIFFLSKSSLQSYLLSQDTSLSKIASIKKTFPNKITIAAVPRTLQFAVATPVEQLLVSNDGFIEQELDLSSTSSAAGLINIKLDNASSTPAGEKLFDENFISSLLTLKNLTESQLRLNLAYFEIDHPQSRDITEFVKEGFKIEFNTALDPQQSVDQVQLVLNSLQDSQRKSLYYIDMRFEGHGFACLQNTPCVQNKPILDVTSTSTPAAASSTVINQ